MRSDQDTLAKAIEKAVGKALAKAMQPQQRATPEVEHVDKNEGVDWKKVMSRCNKCGHTGPVLPDFGVRKARGNTYKQPWCSECRAKTNYYSKARKNRTS